MKKFTARDWTALCRTCKWSGKRHSAQDRAQQEMDDHLKTRPQHRVRVLVTGETKLVDPVAERNTVQDQRSNIQEAWDKLTKRKEEG